MGTTYLRRATLLRPRSSLRRGLLDGGWLFAALSNDPSAATELPTNPFSSGTNGGSFKLLRSCEIQDSGKHRRCIDGLLQILVLQMWEPMTSPVRRRIQILQRKSSVVHPVPARVRLLQISRRAVVDSCGEFVKRSYSWQPRDSS